MQKALIAALRARHIDVLTASEAGMTDKSDEDHLAWAGRDSRVLYSFNIGDDCVLHKTRLSGGKTHGGIILAPQQRYSVGEQLRRLLQIINRVTAEEMRARLEYLANWDR